MRKQKLYAVLIPLAIALMIEIFVFNFSALTSLGKSWTPLPAPEITGNLETDKKNKYQTSWFEMLKEQ